MPAPEEAWRAGAHGAPRSRGAQEALEPRDAPEPPDAALAARIALGDAAAFGTVYDRYAPAVYALAAHTLGAAEAEEVVQDVFLRLWQRAAQFDPSRSPFAAWFMAIARHRVLDELRRRGQAKRIAAAGDVERLLAQAPDPSLTPDADVWLREAAGAVRQALAELPEEQRRVLVLGYFGGFTQAAIAGQLGWPLGTVKKRVRLGIQKLRRSLAGLRDDAERSPQHPPEQSDLSPARADTQPGSAALPDSLPEGRVGHSGSTKLRSSASTPREPAALSPAGGTRD